MTLNATPKGEGQRTVVRFSTYPSDFIRKGHKVVTFSGGRRIEYKHGDGLKGEREVQPGEFWIYARDVTSDKGGYGLSWDPAEIDDGIIKIGAYATQPILRLKGSSATLRLWDLVKLSQEEGLRALQKLERPEAGKDE
jgi:hypothetical protein